MLSKYFHFVLAVGLGDGVYPQETQSKQVHRETAVADRGNGLHEVLSIPVAADMCATTGVRNLALQSVCSTAERDPMKV